MSNDNKKSAKSISQAVKEFTEVQDKAQSLGLIIHADGHSFVIQHSGDKFEALRIDDTSSIIAFIQGYDRAKKVFSMPSAAPENPPAQ